MTYAPDAITNAWNIVKAAMPQAELGGIVSSTGAGYHPSRNAVPPSDYSVQQPYDQGGDPDAASALDVTLRDPADMALVTNRMIAETQAHGDTDLLRGCREFFGTTDGYTVIGMDVPGRYWVTSDPSHVYHLHASGKRDNSNDAATWADIAAVITGGGGQGDDDMSQADIDFMKDQLVEIRRLTAATMNPRGDGEYAIPDQVTMKSRVAVRPYAGNPPDTYTVETVLSELLDLARAIRDAVTPPDPGR